MKRRHLLKLALFALVLLLIGGIVGAIWLAHRQATVLIHPARIPINDTPGDMGIENWENVSFLSTDGVQLYGWFIPPDAEGATIIYVHGLSGNREALLSQAVMLNGHGYGALLFDLRNHGESEGRGVCTLGYYEVNDVQGALAYLETRSDINSSRIGLMGISMGGATVIRAAAQIPQIKTVIVEAPYSSVEDIVGERVNAAIGFPMFGSLIIWFAERESGVNLYQVRPIDDLARIAPRPIMFIHGEQDTSVFPSNSQRLFEAANNPKELYLMPNAGHGMLMEANPHEFEQRVVKFLDSYLKDN